jgi:flagellar biosynthesis protein FliR
MLTPQLSIFSPGDWITFLIGLVLATIGFFILLGWIKRRREGGPSEE